MAKEKKINATARAIALHGMTEVMLKLLRLVGRKDWKRVEILLHELNDLIEQASKLTDKEIMKPDNPVPEVPEEELEGK